MKIYLNIDLAFTSILYSLYLEHISLYLEHIFFFCMYMAFIISTEAKNVYFMSGEAINEIIHFFASRDRIAVIYIHDKI